MNICLIKFIEEENYYHFQDILGTKRCFPPKQEKDL